VPLWARQLSRARTWSDNQTPLKSEEPPNSHKAGPQNGVKLEVWSWGGIIRTPLDRRRTRSALFSPADRLVYGWSTLPFEQAMATAKEKSPRGARPRAKAVTPLC
jgi:hypothetical protein